MKQQVAKSFAEGDLVFAKVRGYPAWPARVMGVGAGQRYQVFFYGTHETGKCKANELWLFDEASKAKMGKQKKKGFLEAMDEIENNPGIALEESMPVADDLDETLDETAMDSTINDSVDAGSSADVTKTDVDTPAAAGSAKKTKKRAYKRKAEESPEKAPPAKAAKTSESGKKSRAGRVIKEKKVEVEESPKNESPRTGQRKMWICIKATGELIELNLDKNRPVSFDSKESVIQWERVSAMNAIILNKRVESGNFLPEEVAQRLEEKTKLTKDEEQILQKAKRENQITWLKIEQRLVDINIEIQKSLSLLSPDMQSALDLLDELKSLSVSKLMFKKQPQTIETIRKLRKYVGPEEPWPDTKEAKEWSSLSEKIRLAANDVFKKIQQLFGMKEGADFVAFFANSVAEFNMATENFPKNKVTYLVSDPTA